MIAKLRTMSLAAGLALSTALAIPMSSAAFAQVAGENDAFGSQQQNAALRAAQSARSPALTAEQRGTLNDAFKVGQNDAFGSSRASQPTLSGEDYQSRLASTVPMVAGKRDLVGSGGHQDALANEIYQPGSHPAGW
jgi:hypothetical protein